METSVHEDMAGEEVLYCGSYGTIQEHLLFNYKNKNTPLKNKYRVTDLSKTNPYKSLDVFMYAYVSFINK